MAIGPRLDLRQTQSLVMTPQLQQAIKLLALSNLEIEAFIGETLEANPLLDLGDRPPEAGAETGTDTVGPPEDMPEEARRTTLESSPVHELIGEGKAEADRPLDLDGAALDRDRDTGDGAPAGPDWGAELRIGGAGEGRSIDDHGENGGTLADHLEAQVGLAAPDARIAAIARYVIGQLDEAGYLPAPPRDIAAELGIEIEDVMAALAVVQSLDPTGVGATSLAECIALQAREADRYDPAMARLIDNLDLVARGDFARLKRLCGVDDEDLADMLAELRGYDPKPGLRFGGNGGEVVTPDILVSARADGGSRRWISGRGPSSRWRPSLCGCRTASSGTGLAS